MENISQSKSGFVEKENIVLEKAKEAIKRISNQFEKNEKEIYKIHTYDIPCIIAIPTCKVNKDYFDWIKGEIEMGEDKK